VTTLEAFGMLLDCINLFGEKNPLLKAFLAGVISGYEYELAKKLTKAS
jgi:hypothetical protein